MHTHKVCVQLHHALLLVLLSNCSQKGTGGVGCGVCAGLLSSVGQSPGAVPGSPQWCVCWTADGGAVSRTVPSTLGTVYAANLCLCTCYARTWVAWLSQTSLDGGMASSGYAMPLQRAHGVGLFTGWLSRRQVEGCSEVFIVRPGLHELGTPGAFSIAQCSSYSELTTIASLVPGWLCHE